MIPFSTSPEQKIRVYEIATKMAKVGLSVTFINVAVEMAEEYEGLHDLMVLWDDETDISTQNKIIADIQEQIDQYNAKYSAFTHHKYAPSRCLVN